MKKTEVLKHSAAVQITNRVNLLERRAWNILLAEAFDELPSKSKHEVGVKDLLQALGLYKSNNVDHLKQMLKSLASTLLEWNVLSKDGKTSWGISSLLSGATIENGKITYSFGEILREKLYNPAMYARISLSIQNRFDSKHALALYELCVDYFDVRRQTGETPWIEIPKFRPLMGLNDEEYPEFKKLNQYVIKQPIRELNKKSNLWVDIEYRKHKRRVTAVKFRITPNPNKENENLQTNMMHPALPGPADIEHPGIYGRLRAYFEFSDKDARDALRKYEPEYIAENLDELERRIKKGLKPEKLGAYTKAILNEDIRIQKSLFDIEKEEQRKAVIEKRQAAEREARAVEEAEAARLEQETKYYEDLYSSLAAKEKKQIDAATINGLDGFWRSQYNEAKRKQQALEEKPLLVGALKAARNRILEQKYPRVEETA